MPGVSIERNKGLGTQGQRARPAVGLHAGARSTIWRRRPAVAAATWSSTSSRRKSSSRSRCRSRRRPRTRRAASPATVKISTARPFDYERPQAGAVGRRRAQLDFREDRSEIRRSSPATPGATGARWCPSRTARPHQPHRLDLGHQLPPDVALPGRVGHARRAGRSGDRTRYGRGHRQSRQHRREQPDRVPGQGRRPRLCQRAGQVGRDGVAPVQAQQPLQPDVRRDGRRVRHDRGRIRRRRVLGLQPQHAGNHPRIRRRYAVRSTAWSCCAMCRTRRRSTSS